MQSNFSKFVQNYLNNLVLLILVVGLYLFFQFILFEGLDFKVLEFFCILFSLFMGWFLSNSFRIVDKNHILVLLINENDKKFFSGQIAFLNPLTTSSKIYIEKNTVISGGMNFKFKDMERKVDFKINVRWNVKKLARCTNNQLRDIVNIYTNSYGSNIFYFEKQILEKTNFEDFYMNLKKYERTLQDYLNTKNLFTNVLDVKFYTV